MTDLSAGTVITGTDAPETKLHFQATGETGVTSTSYAAGANVCGIDFIAPTTGRVLVIWGAEIDNDTAGVVSALSFELRTGSSVGSGSVVASYEAQDEWTLAHRGQNQYSAGVERPVEGLTPGSAYNVRTMHRVTGGTGSFIRREIIVQPLP